jgi:hypothetical protein
VPTRLSAWGSLRSAHPAAATHISNRPPLRHYKAVMNVSRRHIPSGAALAGLIALAGHALAPSLARTEEPPKMSAAFERFKYSLFEDPGLVHAGGARHSDAGVAAGRRAQARRGYAHCLAAWLARRHRTRRAALPSGRAATRRAVRGRAGAAGGLQVRRDAGTNPPK